MVFEDLPSGDGGLRPSLSTVRLVAHEVGAMRHPLGCCGTGSCRCPLRSKEGEASVGVGFSSRRRAVGVHDLDVDAGYPPRRLPSWSPSPSSYHTYPLTENSDLLPSSRQPGVGFDRSCKVEFFPALSYHPRNSCFSVGGSGSSTVSP